MHLIADLSSNKKGCCGKLWLGGEAASGDLGLLERHMIDLCLPASKHPRPAESLYLKVYTYVDGTGLANGDYSLEKFFEQADLVIKRLKQGHSVLICCKNGAHRSATLCCIIIMRMFCWQAMEAANYLSTLRNIVDLESLPPPTSGRRHMVKPIDFLLQNEDRIIKNGHGLRPCVTMTPIQFRKKAMELGFEHVATKPKSAPRRDSGYSSFEFVEPASEANDTESSEASLKRAKVGSGFALVPDELASNEERRAKLQELCSDLKSLDSKLLKRLNPEAATGQAESGPQAMVAAAEKKEDVKEEVKDEKVEAKEEETEKETKAQPEQTKQEDTTGAVQNKPRKKFPIFFEGLLYVHYNQQFLVAILMKLLIFLLLLLVLAGEMSVDFGCSDDEDEPDAVSADPKTVDEWLNSATGQGASTEVFERITKLLEAQRLQYQTMLAKAEEESTRTTLVSDLFRAILSEPLKVLPLLEEVTSTTVMKMQDANGLNLLHQAVRVGSYEIVDRLLALNTNLCDQLTSPLGRPAHWSPLMVLIDTGKAVMSQDVYFHILSRLLRYSSLATLEATASNGSSALHMASSKGMFSTVKKLVYTIYNKAGESEAAIGLVSSLLNKPNGRGLGCAARLGIGWGQLAIGFVLFNGWIGKQSHRNHIPYIYPYIYIAVS